MKFSVKKETFVRFLKCATAVGLSEIRLVAVDNGIETRVLDPAKVALVRVFLRTRVDGEGSYSVDASRILKGVTGMTGSLVVDIDEDGVAITGDRGYYTGELLEFEAQFSRLPKVELPVSFVMDLESFRFALRACKIVSEFIDFVVSEKTVVFRAKNDMDDVIEYTVNREEIITQKDFGEVSSRYRIDYLENAFKFAIGDIVNVSIGNDMPVKLGFSKDNLYVDVIVAPYVEGE